MTKEELEQAATWRRLVAEGRLEEASAMLAPSATGLEGMGFFASEGYSAEQCGDNAAKAGDSNSAHRFYEHALRSYLLYSQYPARGDSEDHGIGLAQDLLAKMAGEQS